VLIGHPASLQAVPFTGHLTTFGGVSFTSTTTDFLPAGGGTGTFVVVGATLTGSFVPLVATSGLVKDLSSASNPVNMAFTLADFLTFAAAPNLHFTLTFIDPGVFTSANCGAAPAAGQTCTPVGSAYNFTNTTSTSSVLSFTVRGTVPNIITGETSDFVGTFTMSFLANYQTILATLNAGGTVTSSYTANFDVTGGVTPTPTTTGAATNTPTPTNTLTPTNTPTSTPTSTNTPTPTNTPAGVPTSTATSTPTSTNTPTPTNTPAGVPTSTATSTPVVPGQNVPTLSEWAFLVFALLLAGVGYAFLRGGSTRA